MKDSPLNSTVRRVAVTVSEEEALLASRDAFILPDRCKRARGNNHQKKNSPLASLVSHVTSALHHSSHARHVPWYTREARHRVFRIEYLSSCVLRMASHVDENILLAWGIFNFGNICSVHDQRRDAVNVV